MDAKLTEIIGINKVNINLRYPALNAIFISIFLKKKSLFSGHPGGFAPEVPAHPFFLPGRKTGCYWNIPNHGNAGQPGPAGII
ncbi:MAG TPA: hypothetical protein DIC22_06175 [Chitinophagaceae bacterium]|jgi:hypothetical protein|nr:hypothetical protein [Chitinophagaceae bacterium]